MSPWDDIGRAVAAATGKPFKINQRASIGGGGINSVYRIEGGDTGYFVKLNSVGKAEMFAAEAAGLQEIARSHTLRVPRPICHGANHRRVGWCSTTSRSRAVLSPPCPQ